METISIIGAGWLGLALGETLVEKGYKVHGTTTHAEKLALLESKGLHAHHWNITKSRAEELRFLEETDVLVFNVPPGKSTGIGGTGLLGLLAAVRQAGVRKLLYTSSTSVYASDGREMKEEDATRLLSPHSGFYMLDMEGLVRQALDIELTILRLGGLFGPGRHPGRWMAGRKLAPGPESPVNMIHLQDCINIISILIERGIWGETYNAVAPEHPTRRDFYAAACAEGGYEMPTWSNTSVSWKTVNSEKLMTELDYTFVYRNPISAF